MTTTKPLDTASQSPAATTTSRIAPTRTIEVGGTAFDYRGIGASRGSVPHTIDEMAADAVAFIRTLGYDQVDLLGFSLGGGVAQVITLAHPELVRRVIL